MTLILTQISKYGILLASDSNLTSKVGHAGAGTKVFQLPYLSAGLCLAGSYRVNGQSMDGWMQRFIAAQASIKNSSLSDFAHNLKEALQSQMTTTEKQSGSLIQIAGYVHENGQAHPEFWFVRNVHGIEELTGEYKDIREDFAISEDFWQRDCRNNNSHIAFEQGGYQLYINGFASGRISYVMLQGILSQFFAMIWRNPNWKFRPPQSLEEAEAFVKLYMQCVNTLFLSSNYPAPFIGGDVQVHRILAPSNTSLVPPASYP